MRYANEEGHPIEMPQEEPVDPTAHPPIEVDPVADFEKARAAMEAQIRQLNEELKGAQAAREYAENDRDLAESDRDQLKLQLDTVQKEKEDVSKQSAEDMQKAAERIYKLRRQIDALRNKPVLWPFLAIVGFAILALLIGMAVDRALMVPRLGEPLSYGCIAFAAFFVGIIWERLGGGICGRKRVCNTELGTGRDCQGRGDR